MPKETKKGKKGNRTNNTRNKMRSRTRNGANLATTTDSSGTETEKKVMLAEMQAAG